MTTVIKKQCEHVNSYDILLMATVAECHVREPGILGAASVRVPMQHAVRQRYDVLVQTPEAPSMQRWRHNHWSRAMSVLASAAPHAHQTVLVCYTA